MRIEKYSFSRIFDAAIDASSAVLIFEPDASDASARFAVITVAVEYFVKDQFEKLGLDAYKEFIHFGLTSQDINNTATPLSLKDAMQTAYYPLLDHLTQELEKFRLHDVAEKAYHFFWGELADWYLDRRGTG